MSTPYLGCGRVQQKTRTRDALVAAARALVADGATPTVEEVSQRAGISRTTGYRYFPSQRSLLQAAHPETAAASLLPPTPPTTVEERLEAVVDAFLTIIRDTEQQQRTMLRLSLESDPGGLPLRQGRAIGWFAEALAPLESEIGTESVQRLARAVRSAVGIEAMVWLTDVAALTWEEASDLVRWTSRAILRSAREGSPP